MERVFLTGGSGFVGGALVRRLARDAREIVALARGDESARQLASLGCEVVRGDVSDLGMLESSMQGCEIVFHVAGVNAFCLRDPSPLWRVNVDGSVNVIEAAARSGVKRVVYTSSAATVGEEQGTVGREDSPHRGWFLSDYERSKYDAERAVLERAARGGPEVVSVNPSSVQGPGRTGGTGKVLIGFLRGSLRAFVDTRMSLVDIDDCVEAHLLAALKGRPGERYIVNGATLRAAEALEIVGRLTGIDRRPRMLPGALATSVGTLVGYAFRLRRRDAPVCREMVVTLLQGHHYDGSRAERELGVGYTPVEETLRRTIAWLAERGLVPESVLGARGT